MKGAHQQITNEDKKERKTRQFKGKDKENKKAENEMAERIKRQGKKFWNGKPGGYFLLSRDK